MNQGISQISRLAVLCCGLALIATLSACRNDMHDQPRYEPLEENTNYTDSSASRPMVEGTVARGFLHENESLYPPSALSDTGSLRSGSAGAASMSMPFPVSLKVLERGQERFNIYCTPCHGISGYGDGIVVRRGYRPPPSYHSDRLRKAPPSHFFDVMTNGFGAMPDYAAQIPAEDRWAIAAYIKALQFSQNASVADVPAEDRSKLK